MISWGKVSLLVLLTLLLSLCVLLSTRARLRAQQPPVNATFGTLKAQTFTNGTGLAQDFTNPLLFGANAAPRADSTCSLNAGNPGTITACTTLNFTQADVGSLVRTVWQYGNRFTGCIASVQSTSSATLGVIAHWTPSMVAATNQIIEDGNGNVEVATVGGTAGASSPQWPDYTGQSSLGQTVTDGSITWTLSGKGSAGACQAAAYNGSSLTGVFTQVFVDDLSAIKQALDLYKSGNTAAFAGIAVQLPNRCMGISDTIRVVAKSGRIGGSSMFADSQSTPPYAPMGGTCLQWLGPRGHPMMQVSAFGFNIHDIAFQGNSNPANKPSACIDMLQAPKGVAVTNQVNSVQRVSCNYGSRIGLDPDAGYSDRTNLILGTPLPTLSTYGILWNPAINGNNERIDVKQFAANAADACIGFNAQQMADVSLMGLYCAGTGEVIAQPWTGDATVRNLEAIGTGTDIIMGNGGRLNIDGLNNEVDNNFYANMPNNRGVEFLSIGGHVTITNGGLDADFNMPPSGVFIDGNGTGILPVWPGPNQAISLNQLIQPPASYLDYPGANQYVEISSPPQWYPYSPFVIDYVIKPVNNNPGGFYYMVTTGPGPTGPGFTGATEPAWNQTVGATTDDPVGFTCGSAAWGCGIRWKNIGSVLPVFIMVPQLGNPNGYAYEPIVGGQLGTTQPGSWCQSVGCTQVDNQVTWQNVGLPIRNPNNWVFKATVAGTTGAASPPLSQALNATTTDGSVTWTTTLAGANASITDLHFKDFTFGTGVGMAVTRANATVNLNPATVGAAGPQIFFNCENCAGLSGSQVPNPPYSGTFAGLNLVSNDGGFGTNSWYRQFKLLMRPAYAAGNLYADSSTQLPMNHAVPTSQQADFFGRTSAYGQFNVNAISQPTNVGGFCNMPAWGPASQLAGPNYVIKPTSGNAGAYFFQNQNFSCIEGTTQPASWNQSPGGTTADGSCTWTNVGDGSGVAASNAAGLYYFKFTMNDGLPSAGLPQNSLPNSNEQSVKCGPTNSQPQANISITPVVVPGADAQVLYMGLASGGEKLVVVAPVGSDNGWGTIRVQINEVPAPAWTANTLKQAYRVISNGGNVYVATKSGVTGASLPTFNATPGAFTNDGSQTWVSYGAGTVPTTGNTGQATIGGPLIVNGSLSVAGQSTLSGGFSFTGTFNIPPVAIASLPGTCTAGDVRTVNNWNATAGVCAAGAPNISTSAVCTAGNTWNCP